jgi:hypothetical protein
LAGGAIPWKIVAGAGLVLALIIGAVVTLVPSSKPASALAPKAVTAPPAPEPAAEEPATTGQIAVATQPAGLKVLLDGKPAGETPVTLADISPGRHIVTLMGAAGAIKRTVRVEAGKSVSLDVPVFSGFVAISAPFIVEVSENGRPLGTSENQVILTPGHHDLRLTNRDLRFSVKEVVDVEPGEVQRIELDPRGTVNINAQPWAEVWIDGKKVGETPLANLSVPLGAREIVFKHPQFGERRVTTTIISGTAAAVTMDFTKQ